MKIETTWINGKTQDYSVINGIIQKNNNLLTEAYSRIVTPLGSYFFDKNFGSKIPLWINQRVILSSDIVTTEILRSTQPIVNQGRAKNISVKLTAPITRTAIFFLLTIIDNSGIDIQLDSNYISIPDQIIFG